MVQVGVQNDTAWKSFPVHFKTKYETIGIFIYHFKDFLHEEQNLLGKVVFILLGNLDNIMG